MTVVETDSVRLRVFAGALVPVSLLLAITIFRFGILDGITATALLVGCLLAHEAGHCLMALLTNTRVSEIGLCVRGAYTRRDQAEGFTELLISAAGVIVNAMIAVAFWNTSGILLWLAQMNAILVVINLLPIRGSDGQRMLAKLRELTTTRAPQHSS